MVAIKGMIIPNNCVICNRIGLQQAIKCDLYNGYAHCDRRGKRVRHPNCPLVEIEEEEDNTHDKENLDKLEKNKDSSIFYPA